MKSIAYVAIGAHTPYLISPKAHIGTRYFAYMYKHVKFTTWGIIARLHTHNGWKYPVFPAIIACLVTEHNAVVCFAEIID